MFVTSNKVSTVNHILQLDQIMLHLYRMHKTQMLMAALIMKNRFPQGEHVYKTLLLLMHSIVSFYCTTYSMHSLSTQKYISYKNKKLLLLYLTISVSLHIKVL